MKKIAIFSLALLVLFVSLAVFRFSSVVRSVPPSNVSDTLSSSQYSYFAYLAVGNTAGDNLVKIDTSAGPSKTSNNLFIGDTVLIGTGGTMNIYTIKDIGLTNAFYVNPGVSAVDLGNSAVAIATRSAQHTVSFQPQVNATGGHWQFLLKATNTSGEKWNDKIPDQNGFDAGLLVAGNVTCPYGATASVGTTTAIAVGSTSATPTTFSVVDCALGAGITTPVGGGATGTIVIGTQVSGFINPTPSHAASAEGNADVFTYVLRELDASSNLVDQTVGRLAVVESVRISATVDPTITFYVDNVGVTNSGSAVCGTNASNGAANTTGDSVTYGSLALNAFNQLAQRLSCVTNSANGYTVTAYESQPMHNVNGDGTTIADTNCDGACTMTTQNTWTTDTSHSEFGYSLENVTNSQAAFTTGYKPFGIGATSAQTIMSRSSTPPSTDQIRVCYRVTASTTQEAGDYEAKVVYTATATF